MDYSIVRSHAEVLKQLGVPLWLAVQLLACTNSKLLQTDTQLLQR